MDNENPFIGNRVFLISTWRVTEGGRREYIEPVKYAHTEFKVPEKPALTLLLIQDKRGRSKIVRSRYPEQYIKTLQNTVSTRISIVNSIVTPYANCNVRNIKDQYRDKLLKSGWYKLTDEDIADIQCKYFKVTD